MKNPTLFIRKIWQQDNHVFSIEWNDGVIQNFRLCDLQRECPCAACVDEGTGKRIKDPKSVPEDLKAISICNVGRYGLRIRFTSGCSMGIYHIDKLREGGQCIIN